MDQSQAFKLNREDLKKILKGLSIAMGGAGVAYLLGILDVIDVGDKTPLYVALASTLLNALKVLISGATK